MDRQFNYGVYGVGRIGKVHAAILQEQGHKIVAITGLNRIVAIATVDRVVAAIAEEAIVAVASRGIALCALPPFSSASRKGRSSEAEKRARFSSLTALPRWRWMSIWLATGRAIAPTNSHRHSFGRVLASRANRNRKSGLAAVRPLNRPLCAVNYPMIDGFGD